MSQLGSRLHYSSAKQTSGGRDSNERGRSSAHVVGPAMAKRQATIDQLFGHAKRQKEGSSHEFTGVIPLNDKFIIILVGLKCPPWS